MAGRNASHSDASLTAGLSQEICFARLQTRELSRPEADKLVDALCGGKRTAEDHAREHFAESDKKLSLADIYKAVKPAMDPGI